MLTIVPSLLRQPTEFFESVRRGEAVNRKVGSLFLSAVLFLAIYGLVMGAASHGWQQALSSALKMPVLFVATVLFCLPAFYFFSLVLRTPLNLLQVATVVLSGVAVSAFLLLGLSPITLFFVLTSDNWAFFQLLAVAFVAVSGLIGVYFVWLGMTVTDLALDDATRQLRQWLLGGWFMLYGFVGSQMAWRLSPFIGNPELPFYFIHPSRDNFYMDVLLATERVSGVSSGVSSLNAFAIAAIFVLGLGWFVYSIGAAAGRQKMKRATKPASSEAG